jgi:hypothetical protein
MRFSRGCARFRRWISLQQDSLLTPKREAELQRHLAVCSGCRAARDLTQDIGEVLRTEPEVAIGETFDDGVVKRHHELQMAPIGWPRLREFAFGTVAAALVVGFALQYAATPEAIVRPEASPNSAVEVSPDEMVLPFLTNPSKGLWDQSEASYTGETENAEKTTESSG